MNPALISLLQLSDTALPVGGYAHSAGLETYVQKGLVHDVMTATEFVSGMLGQNIKYTDAAFVSLAYNAAQANDINGLVALDQLCSAIKIATEARQASNKMGVRLIKIFEPLVSSEITKAYQYQIQVKNCAGHHSIAFGMYAARLGIEKVDMLTGYYFNAAAGFVTNAVKLIPLGQQDGQEMLFGLHRFINELAQASLMPDESKLGLCCPGFDLRCMQHEQLYSRLYMS